MPARQARLYLVCYDITDPKRLGRVHRFLRRGGLPVQYSVFTANLTVRQVGILLAGLSRLIDARSDDVRAYPLASLRDRVSLGRQYFPDDVMLIEGGLDLLGTRR